jgi:hypothetical protein
VSDTLHKCVECIAEPFLRTLAWQIEKDTLEHALQLASCRTQGYKKGWLCKLCAKKRKVSYKVVDEIMKELPDWKFQRRHPVKQDWRPVQEEEPEEC